MIKLELGRGLEFELKQGVSKKKVKQYLDNVIEQVEVTDTDSLVKLGIVFWQALSKMRREGVFNWTNMAEACDLVWMKGVYGEDLVLCTRDEVDRMSEADTHEWFVSIESYLSEKNKAKAAKNRNKEILKDLEAAENEN